MMKMGLFDKIDNSMTVNALEQFSEKKTV